MKQLDKKALLERWLTFSELLNNLPVAGWDELANPCSTFQIIARRRKAVEEDLWKNYQVRIPAKAGDEWADKIIDNLDPSQTSYTIHKNGKRIIMIEVWDKDGRRDTFDRP